MNLVFYSTNDVFAAEELLSSKGIITSIEPTPVQDKAYCGVCVKVSEDDIVSARILLSEFEYNEVK